MTGKQDYEACGKALGAIPSTTVGYERLYSWWGSYLAADDEAGFVEELLEGQPDAPFYFGRMKNQNRRGPAVMGERALLPQLDAQQVARLLAADEATFVDTRSAAEVHAGTVTGALNIPAGGSVATYAAWAAGSTLSGITVCRTVASSNLILGTYRRKRPGSTRWRSSPAADGPCCCAKLSPPFIAPPRIRASWDLLRASSFRPRQPERFRNCGPPWPHSPLRSHPWPGLRPIRAPSRTISPRHSARCGCNRPAPSG
jgi:hypothetical protein